MVLNWMSFFLKEGGFVLVLVIFEYALSRTQTTIYKLVSSHIFSYFLHIIQIKLFAVRATKYTISFAIL